MDDPRIATHWAASVEQRTSWAATMVRRPRNRIERNVGEVMPSTGCEMAPPRGSGDGAGQGVRLSRGRRRLAVGVADVTSSAAVLRMATGTRTG
jgi:hypothetical protein